MKHSKDGILPQFVMHFWLIIIHGRSRGRFTEAARKSNFKVFISEFRRKISNLYILIPKCKHFVIHEESAKQFSYFNGGLSMSILDFWNFLLS